MSDLKERLVAEAAENLAGLPQYVGFHDDWVVARIKRNLRSRGAPIATKGEFVLLDPDSVTTPEHPDVIAGFSSPGFVTVYLPNHWVSGGCHTSVKTTDVEVLA